MPKLPAFLCPTAWPTFKVGVIPLAVLLSPQEAGELRPGSV